MSSIKRKWSAGFLHVPKLRTARKIAIAIVGGTVTLIGVVLIVLPGPAFIVIPVGLSILATEFLWARRWMHKIRGLAGHLKKKKKPDA